MTAQNLDQINLYLKILLDESAILDLKVNAIEKKEYLKRVKLIRQTSEQLKEYLDQNL